MEGDLDIQTSVFSWNDKFSQKGELITVHVYVPYATFLNVFVD